MSVEYESKIYHDGIKSGTSMTDFLLIEDVKSTHHALCRLPSFSLPLHPCFFLRYHHILLALREQDGFHEAAIRCRSDPA